MCGSRAQRASAGGPTASRRATASAGRSRPTARCSPPTPNWDWDTVTTEARAYEAPIERFEPRYLEEIRGIAEGAGLDDVDVLAINVRTEVMFAAKARQVAERRPPRGRSAPRSPSARASADGHTLIGQNWDWLLHAADTWSCSRCRQDEGPDFVTVVEAGLLAKTGMNSAGIGLVTNALVSDADRGEPGIPYHVSARRCSTAETVADAYAVLQRGVPLVVGQLPDRAPRWHRCRHRGRARRLRPAVPAVPERRAAAAHEPLPIASDSPAATSGSG